MWWGVVLIVAVVAVVGYTALLNARPARCPVCRRVNIFRRSRTGERRDERDDEGDVRRAFTQFRCGLCGTCYWMVSDDFVGRSVAAAPPPPMSDAELGAGAIRKSPFHTL